MIHYPFGVKGTLTRVLEAGSGDDVMILVHGVGARADRWQRVMTPLADAGFHVYAADLPGHGFAQKGQGPDYSVPGYSQFVADLIDELGHADRRVVLMGTSLGGHVCGHLAASAPEIVDALILVGSIGLVAWGPERREATRQRLGDVSEAGVRRKLSIVVHDPVHVTEEWVAEEQLVNGSPGAAESFAAIAEYIGNDLDNDLVAEPLMAVSDRFPIQLIWGAEERSVPVETGRTAHDMFPGSEFELIAGTAHAPFHEAPDVFVELVTDFLSRRRSAPSGPAPK